jgi:hypothetical protein
MLCCKENLALRAILLIGFMILTLNWVTTAWADSLQILVTNVRPWKGGDTEPNDRVNVLVRDNRIVAISPGPVSVDGPATIIDGEGRIIMGKLRIGEAENLLVVDGDPTTDITILANPESAFLIMRNGSIENDVPHTTSLANCQDHGAVRFDRSRSFRRGNHDTCFPNSAGDIAAVTGGTESS